MAITRHATGSSKPRQFVVTEPSVTTTKKRTTKPKTKKTTAGRVTKPTTTKTTTTHKRKPTLADKAKGAVKKAVGTVERKPGKKAAGTSEMRGHDGKKKTTATKKKL